MSAHNRQVEIGDRHRHPDGTRELIQRMMNSAIAKIDTRSTDLANS
jgi:hypothetical protein